jgi:hypothetical protein
VPKQHLSNIPKVILLWIDFQWLEHLDIQGTAAKALDKKTTDAPDHTLYQLGKQKQTPIARHHAHQDERAVTKWEKVSPGKTRFSDQNKLRFQVQSIISHGSIIKKDKKRQRTVDSGQTVKTFCTDNGTCTTYKFIQRFSMNDQAICSSGAHGHYQNGFIQNDDKKMVQPSRTMMSHENTDKCYKNSEKLWHLVLQCRTFIYSYTPEEDTSLYEHNTFQIQDWYMVSKWELQSCQGQLDGLFFWHMLVRNLQMGNISPQIHPVYDKWFQTMHTNGTKELILGNSTKTLRRIRMAQ